MEEMAAVRKQEGFSEYADHDWKCTRQLTNGSRGDLQIEIGRLGNRIDHLCLRKQPTNDGSRERLLRESLILADVKHDNVVRFLGHQSPSQSLLFEYLDFNMQPLFSNVKRVNNLRQFLGTLDHDDMIFEANNKYQCLDRIFADVVFGLAYLHQVKVVHGNVVPSNILLTNSPSDLIGRAKIAGFSHARKFDENSEALPPPGEILNSGDLYFKAPEMIYGRISGAVTFSEGVKCDVWSIGCIGFCLLNPDLPHPYQAELGRLSEADSADRFKTIMRSEYTFQWSAKYEKLDNPDLSDKTRKCLQFDPEHRIDSETLEALCPKDTKQGNLVMATLDDFMRGRLRQIAGAPRLLSFHDVTDGGRVQADQKEIKEILQIIIGILKKLLMIYPEYCQSRISDSGRSRSLSEYHHKQVFKEPNKVENFMGNIGIHDLFTASFVLCDPFLRKTLYSKAFMCKLAVPFIVEPIKDNCFNIYTNELKGIHLPVIQSGFHKEVNCFYHNIKIVSFVGVSQKSWVSKSETINRILGGGFLAKPNTFYDRSWSETHNERKYAEGVVEAAWYLPSGAEYDTFSSELMFLNLRGRSNICRKQTSFLSEVSAILVLFVMTSDLLISDDISRIYQDMRGGDSQHLIIVLIPHELDIKGSKLVRDRLARIFPGKPENVHIVEFHHSHRNTTSLKSAISGILRTSTDLLEYSGETLEKKIDTFEFIKGKGEELQLAYKYFTEMLPHLPRDINSSLNLKMPVLWQEWVELKRKLDREQVEAIHSQTSIKVFMTDTRKEQLTRCSKPYLCTNFMETCLELFHKNRLVALRALVDNVSCHLQNWALAKYADLNEHYLEKCRNLELQQHDLSFLDDGMETSSENFFFGIHLLFRDVSQIYEAIADVRQVDKRTKLAVHLQRYEDYPKVFSVLLKSGFTFELMDGDAGGVPIKWLKSVIEALKVELPHAKILIVGVLGVQSSGKSTLLNAMFGLEFPVSAGGCTRGVFARLVKIANRQGFDYVLVLDTEGIRGTDDEECVKKDNELVTFLVGLSDIVIINVKGELYLDVAHVLQVAVHAFMRMRLHNKVKQCLFVHQNVAAPDAGAKLAPRRRKLIKTLNSAVADAAEREGETDLTNIQHIMDIQVERDVFYLGDLWAGEPPMAGTNPHYHLNVRRVKQRVFDKASNVAPKDWNYLYDHIKALWEGIMTNAFVFKFRNLPDMEDDIRLRVIEKNIDVDTYVFQYCGNEARVAFSECNTREELDNAERDLLKKQEGHLKDIVTQSSEKDSVDGRVRKSSIDALLQDAKRKLHERVQSMRLSRWRQVVDKTTSYFSNGAQIKSVIEKAAQEISSPKSPGSGKRVKDIRDHFERVWDKSVEGELDKPPVLDYVAEAKTYLEKEYPVDKSAIAEYIAGYGSAANHLEFKDVLKQTDLSNLGKWVIFNRDRRSKGLFGSTKPEDVLKGILKNVEHLLKKKLNHPTSFTRHVLVDIVGLIKENIKTHNEKNGEFTFTKPCEVEFSTRILLASRSAIMEAHRRYDDKFGFSHAVAHHKQILFQHFKSEIARNVDAKHRDAKAEQSSRL